MFAAIVAADYDFYEVAVFRFFLIFWCFSIRHSDFSSIDYLRRSSLRNPRSTKVAFPTGLASRAGSGVPVTASAASHAELALFQLPRRLADNPGSFTQFNFGESERARIRGGDSTRVRLPRPFPPPSQRGALQARGFFFADALSGAGRARATFLRPHPKSRVQCAQFSRPWAYSSR